MTEYTGEAFRPVFEKAMGDWWNGGCKGVCPMENWECKTDLGGWDTGTIAGTPDYFSRLRYRFKPTPRRTVTIGCSTDTGIYWKTLVAPEIEAQPTTALLQQALGALEPFFADAERVHPDWASERRRSSLSQDKPVTVGDFRKAHAAYLSVEAALAAGVREAQPRKLSESEVWANDAIMAMNAEAGLSMSRLMEFVRAVEAGIGAKS